jgi:hypothetical protein
MRPQITHNPEYTLIKDKASGAKLYIATCTIGLQHRQLHRAFARARDAIRYGEQVKKRAMRWVQLMNICV